MSRQPTQPGSLITPAVARDERNEVVALLRNSDGVPLDSHSGYGDHACSSTIAVSAPPTTEAARVCAQWERLPAVEALKSCEGLPAGPPAAWRCHPPYAAGRRRVDPRFAAPWRK